MGAMNEQPVSLATDLHRLLQARLKAQAGWLPFDRFMALALYAPGAGYYSVRSRPIGRMPSGGSDFVTAPLVSPYFGQALARSVHEALQHTGTQEVLEFGAGDGTLAKQLLQALGDQVQRYCIVEVSAHLREQQAACLQDFAHKVQWLNALPDTIHAVVVGNEVLDAMPVKLLNRINGVWHERGVTWDAGQQRYVWQDKPTDLRPPCPIEGDHDYLCEIHLQAQAFISSLAERLRQGAAFFIDYGFPEHEYYHVQRHMGTLMCHQEHQSDTDPLSHIGRKDITSHVDFTAMALTAQQAGLHCLGYTSQAHFLINSGLLTLLESACATERQQAQMLIQDHEMGELFKVLALGAEAAWEPMGFVQGDRSHRL
jgi:SAM-dependent MidA family methyltransferase